MKQELVDKAIDAAATSIAQANDSADRAESAKELSALSITLSSKAAGSDAEPKLFQAGAVALLNAVAHLLEENNNLLRAVVAHTGAALPSSDDKQDLFEKMYRSPEDDLMDVPF